MIKIIHTGDVHFDSPFYHLDPSRARIRAEEVRSSFSTMMNYAKKNGVDIILIAGDFFDSRYVTRETVGVFIREAKSVSAEIFITPGNHDPVSATPVYAKEGVFPENVHIFTKDSLEKISIDRLGVDVYGYGFTDEYLTKNPIEGRSVEDPSRFNILVGHADTRSPDSKFCPVDEHMIRSFGADYTALAHIHNAPEPRKLSRSVWAYCGCFEGRDFDESGIKGALLIEADKHDGAPEISVRRLRFSKRRCETSSLDVGGAASEDDLIKKINSFIDEKGYGEETLLSLDLTGEVPASLIINEEKVSSRIAGLFCFEAHDKTTAAGTESLSSDPTVKGLFYRELASSANGDDVNKEQALKYGLAALEGANIENF